jgi:phage-related protein
MWIVEYLPAAAKERQELSADLRAQLFRMVSLIEERGFDDLPHDWVKSLGNKLWELRIRGRDGIARAIYITAKGQRIVIVRVFVKKTQKTPQQELALARKRAREVL